MVQVPWDCVESPDGLIEVLVAVVLVHKELLQTSQRIADHHDHFHLLHEVEGIVGQRVSCNSGVVEAEQLGVVAFANVAGAVCLQQLLSWHEFGHLALAKQRVVFVGLPTGEVQGRVLVQVVQD